MFLLHDFSPCWIGLSYLFSFSAATCPILLIKYEMVSFQRYFRSHTEANPSERELLLKSLVHPLWKTGRIRPTKKAVLSFCSCHLKDGFEMVCGRSLSLTWCPEQICSVYKLNAFFKLPSLQILLRSENQTVLFAIYIVTRNKDSSAVSFEVQAE